MFGLYKNLRQCLHHFTQCERGSVIIITCLATSFVLIVVAALALDLTRGEILQGRISSALDASGLAVEKQVQTIPVSNRQAWANAQALRYFNANFQTNYLGSSPIVPVVNPVTPDWKTIALNAGSTIPTLMMKQAGAKTMNVGASSQVSIGAAGGLEVVMPIDNTFTMLDPIPDGNGGMTTKLAAAQQAACLLVTILYGNNGDPSNYCNPPKSQTTIPGLWISVIPYTSMVNVGTSHYVPGLQHPWDDPHNWIDFKNDPNIGKWNSGNDPKNSWQGCVTSRSTTKMPQPTQIPTSPTNYDDNDLAPSQLNYPNTYFQTLYNEKPSDGNHNYYCPKPLTSMIGAQAGDEQTLLTNISATFHPPGEDTSMGIALAWAARMLSPAWRGKWGGEMDANGLPLNWNTPGNTKEVVLLTDGTGQFLPDGDKFGWKTAYGWFNDYPLGDYTGSPVNGQCTSAFKPSLQKPKPAYECLVDSRSKDVADNYLKNNGVTVYVIGFGNPGQIDIPLLSYLAGPPGSAGQNQTCSATGPYCFLAYDQKTLLAAFSLLGTHFQNLRISK